MKIRLATLEIQRDSIVDGEGIRAVIWTQGCGHHCPGCHNPSTHSFDKGLWADVDDVKNKIDELEAQDGITFSGGDPMEQAEACMEIAKHCQNRGLNVWCYTGYTYEELLEKAEFIPAIGEFLKYIDVLVDGRFVLAEKSYDVIFRGSKNQRLIDIPQSLKKNQIILLKKYNTSDIDKKGRKNHYMYI